MPSDSNVPGPASGDVQSQILHAFNFRHACKLFDPGHRISEGEFDTLLQTARLSPSSFGMEPWQLLVIQTPEKRELLRKFLWGANGASYGTAGQLGTASHFCIFLAHTGATMQHHSEYLQRHLQEVKQLPPEVIAFYNDAYQKFQEHDFHIENDRHIVDWSARQAYIALANMMTAAALMGIDSCPIEGFEMDGISTLLEQHFGIDPKLLQPAVMVAFGYRAEDPAFPKTRRDMADIVTWA